MEEKTMREEKFHIYLNDDEYSRVIQSLIRLKNSLIAQGRYTDGVDDVLRKIMSAKKRKLKIKYI
jgi:orfG2-1